MAVAQGYGKTVTSGSVFAYDTGDTRNSYIGQPGTNITTGITKSYSGYNITTYSPGVFFETNGYSETVNIPALGTVTAQSVEINNSASGYQCCPNLFSYTGGFNSNIWTPGQVYTYQIIFKTRSGYTHPNFMYHYQYTSGASYITEYGLLDTNKMESLGDGWFHAWNTFTVGGTAVKGYTGLWYYNYNVADKVSIAAIAITPGSTIRPPKQIIPSGTTRSVTQGLLPLVGNSTIDLTNVSFDSNAQMTFDGTDDLVDITTNFGTLSAYTFEYVAYANSGGNMPIASRTNTNFYKYGAYSWRYTHGGVGGEFYHNYGNDTGWAHWVITYDGSTISVWENGVSKGTSSSSGTADFSGGIRIGSWASSAAYTWDGTIPVMKMYNRGLSAGEVRQNYLHYKTRFNLS